MARWLKKLRKRLRRSPGSPEREKTPIFFERYPTRLPMRAADRRFAISHPWRYVYARVPKAANSTIVATLHGADRDMSFAEMKSVKAEYAAPSQLDARQLEELESSYFKFSFVRHPTLRILSAYLDKIVSPRPEDRKKRHEVAQRLGRAADAEIDLHGFVDYLEAGGIDENAHWARQVDLLLMPPDSFDFIGKVESLEQDLAAVTRRIFGSARSTVSFTLHATSASDHTGLLDAALERRILRLYQADFDTFAYPASPWPARR